MQDILNSLADLNHDGKVDEKDLIELLFVVVDMIRTK